VRVRVRPATPDDLPAIQGIYAHHVAHGLASFEEEAPPLQELRRRYEDVIRQSFPYLVAELGDQIAGYGYCNLYRTRSAYRYALEDSVYVRHDMAGRGIGKAILAELIARCEALGCRQLIAVIGDSANAASIGLHTSQGFLKVGTLRSVGFKLGRWVDSVFMQRPLGPGDGTPPSDR
jgi:L-amino acid N-acyltransferase YncA